MVCMALQSKSYICICSSEIGFARLGHILLFLVFHTLLHCFLAGEDEISFDPSDIITEIEQIDE